MEITRIQGAILPLNVYQATGTTMDNRNEATTCIVEELKKLGPDSGNMDINKKLDYLTSLILLVVTGLTDIGKSLTFNQGEITDLKKEISILNERLHESQTNVSKLENNLLQARKDHQILQDHVIKLESQSRRDNLILDGIPEKPNESNEDCLNSVYSILENHMNIPETRAIKIVRCHRLGSKRQQPGRPRSMIFKLHFFGDRERIWRNKTKLKGTQYWLSEDFPNEIKRRRRILQPIAKYARTQFNQRASVSVDRLVIEGKSYSTNTLSHLPEKLQPKNIFTPRSNGVTAFYTHNSLLSNFYKCNITSNGVLFHSSEQHYQYLKAKSFNDEETANKILQASTPYDCYSLGQSVTGFNRTQWLTDLAPKCMLEAVKAKFLQHKNLAAFLKSTEGTVLCEASRKDLYWGVGLSLADKNIFQQQSWKGKNQMGTILTQVRSEL